MLTENQIPSQNGNENKNDKIPIAGIVVLNFLVLLVSILAFGPNDTMGWLIKVVIPNVLFDIFIIDLFTKRKAKS